MPLLEQRDAVLAIVSAMEHLATWPMKSAEAFRNAILGDGAIAINPLLNIHDEEQADFLREMIAKTVREGRMIDFGVIPNEVLKAESMRSRNMFEAGEFHHPYEDWVAVTRWEGGFNAYHISATVDPIRILVVEMYGVSFPSEYEVMDMIIVYDVVSIQCDGIDQTYTTPFPMTFPPGGDIEPASRAANSLDPMVTMLRVLADASIPLERREVSERLNQARVRKGRHPIPPHVVADVRDYVSNFSHTPPSRGKGKGGHHASPTAHWRMAHQRRLRDGRKVFVRASRVNWRDTEELHRMFYRVEREKK